MGDLVVADDAGDSGTQDSEGVNAAKAARRAAREAGDDGSGANVGKVDEFQRAGVVGPGRYYFRSQLFWQEIRPEQVVTDSGLEFKMSLDDSRNWARTPNNQYSAQPEALPDDDPRLIAEATCKEGRKDEDEVAIVMRAAASWGQHMKVRRLLVSAYVSPHACKGALCVAAGQGHEDVVGELLRAKAFPSSTDGPSNKTALHFACEQGHESIASMLLRAGANISQVDSSGRTPCQVARDADLCGVARRLEKLAAELSQASPPSATPALEAHGNHVEHFVPGLYALAFFILALTGLKKLCNSKQLRRLQKPLMYV